MNITLTSTRLFRGIDTAQLQPLLQCLGAVQSAMRAARPFSLRVHRPNSSVWCSPVWP